MEAPGFAALERQTARDRTGRLAAGLIANTIILLALVLSKPTESSTHLRQPATRVLLFAPVPVLAQPRTIIAKPRPRTVNLDLAKSEKAPINTAPINTAPMAEPPLLRVAPVNPPIASFPPPPPPPPPKPILGTFSEAPTKIAKVEVPRRELSSDSGFGSPERSATTQKASISQVTSSGFDASITAPTSRRRIAVLSAEFNTKAVEILGKPRPLYTEEARRLRIEGAVLLRILFGADGRLRVQSIVRGLGHGLDENAALAASQIQFRPATQNGQAIDQSAVIRVQFQLAE